MKATQHLTSGWFKPLRAITRTMRKGQNWSVSPHGHLRLRLIGNCDPVYCPITWVARAELGQYYDGREFRVAADRLHLDAVLAENIADAADRASAVPHLLPRHVRLRSILLRAAGLRGNAAQKGGAHAP